ncbi:DUF2189 domain-containing protein [Epibacterium sp. SM1969]|uniref:DUF2189 domain-containing protein n=1 Tax=Tritonibacter aquimaris TaxID=2663379 RepID=A0A844ALG3_9RHOB|nr:DUF2189 domain-containing protein [Tritonibacter aquimaris]MQY42449.1 DUF2189 domain-containing protein [Tritonibacter aquimaris]
MDQTIGNPASWLFKALRGSAHHIGQGVEHLGTHSAAPPQVRTLSLEDLRVALRLGLRDFAACRSDAMFLVFLYPLIGAAMISVGLSERMFALLVPMVFGFAILGPVAAVGLYEMSARREAGFDARWGDAFGVLRSPAFMSVLTLGIMLGALFICWLIAAQMLYYFTLGPTAPESFSAFAYDVIMTQKGQIMAVCGMIIGAGFALVALAMSLVSFQLLLDRRVGLPVAVATSMQLLRKNPRICLIWGALIGTLLVLGSLPFFVGLIIVIPVLGHASWHFYRRAVV